MSNWLATKALKLLRKDMTENEQQVCDFFAEQLGYDSDVQQLAVEGVIKMAFDRNIIATPDHTELLREAVTDLEYICVRLQNGIIVLDKQLERDARAALTYATQTISKLTSALAKREG